jgi:hypothetical protein
MADVQTSEVDEKLAPLNVGPYNFAYWQIFQWWTTCKRREETKYTNVMACLKLKFILYCMKTTHKLLHFVWQMKFGAVNIHEHDEAFTRGDATKC